jgi:hypothetical protein
MLNGSPPVREPGRSLARLERLTRWLDDGLQVPGTSWRVGWDPVLGLIPGAGDALGLVLSSVIVLEAARLGAPGASLFRMVMNLGVDALAGSVPLVGDLFDAGWKANRRNLRLLQRVLDDPQLSGRRDRFLLWALGTGLLLMIAGAVTMSVLVIAALLRLTNP